MKPTRNPYLLGAAFATLVLSHTVTHAAGIWDGTVGNFDVATNWDNDAVPVAINTDVSNGGTIQVTTDHTTNDILAGTTASSTGTWEQSAGNLTMGGGWFRLGTAAGATGNFNLSGGTLATTGEQNIGEAPGAFGNVVISGGTWNKGGGADVRLAVGGNSRAVNGGTGTLAISAGALNNNAALMVGAGPTGDGTLTSTGGTITNAGVLAIGFAGGKGRMTVSDNGLVNINNEIWVGDGGGSVGTLNFNAGQVNVTGWLAVGRTGGTGTFNMTGGTYTKNANPTNASIIGATGPGTFNQTGGNFNIGSGPTWLGEVNSGVWNISGGNANIQGVQLGVNNGASGTINLQGNTGLTGALPNGGGTGVISAGVVTMGGPNGGTGTSLINLDGGTLAVNRLVGGGTLASRVVNFNGGTLRLRANDAPLAPSVSDVTTNVNVGGAKIDSGGFNGTIGTVLAHAGVGTDGGLTKGGAGTLTLTQANTYNGPGLVTGGALVAATTASLPNWNVLNANTVQAGGALGARIGAPGLSLGDFSTLISSGNYQNGSSVAFDTTNADLSYDVSNLHTATSAGATVGLYKSGSGVLTATGTPSFTGPIAISGGTLVFTGGIPANRTLAVDGGILDLNGVSVSETSLTVGSGQLISTGGSTLTLTSTGNAITFNGTGTFTPPSIAATVNISLTGATGGNIIKSVNTGTPAMNGNLNLGGQTRTIALADTGGDAFPELTLGGVVSNGAITLDNTLGGTSLQEWGSLLLSGANTYAGVTNIAVGRLEITNAMSLGTTAGNTIIGSRGTLAFGGSGQNIDPGISVAENLTINRNVVGNYGLIAIQNNSGVNTLTGTITTSGDLEVQSNAGSLAFANPIVQTAPFAFTKSGGADVIFNAANTYTGLTTIVGGGLVANNANALGTSAAGTEVRDTGRLVLGSGLTFGAESLVINGAGGNGGGALQAAAGGTSVWTSDITLGSIGNAGARIGAQAGGTLTVNGVIKDGTSTQLDLSGLASTGTIILKGNNTYTGLTSLIRGNVILDGGQINSGADVQFGTSASSEPASVTIQNGAVINGNTVVLAYPAAAASVDTAVWTQNSGVVNSKQWMTFGRNGAGTAVANISGGELNVKTVATGDPNSEQSLEVGVFDSVKATVNISGTATVRLLNDANIAIGSQGNNAANTLNQDGGTVTFYSDGGTTIGGTGELRIVQNGTGNNAYNLNGGTLTVPKITKGGGSGTGTLYFNGGTLKPTGSAFDFIQLVNAQVRNGAAIIDSNGFDVTVAVPLVHSALAGDSLNDGGLTKLGVGTLTFLYASTYTGDTRVDAGTLQVFEASTFSDAAAVRIGSTATLELLVPGTDTVNKFFINGVAQATGVWGPLGSTAPNKTARITGEGFLNVTNAVISTPFQTWAGDNGLAGADAAVGADPDKDGYNNLGEFILGGQPNPANANAGSTPQGPTVTASGGNHIFAFRRSQVSGTQAGLTVNYEYGNTLVGWATAPSVPDGVTVVGPVQNPAYANFYGPGIDKVEVIVPDSLAPVGKRFVRMKAIQN
ncbi:MAG: autotransporter-associated beta strand repeat-containing protein [Verrucomicrobiota bacterium]